MVALGSTVLVTFLLGGFVLYQLVVAKIEAARSESKAREQRLQAEVARVTRESANTKLVAETAVYTAQRAEEKARERQP